MGVLNLPDTSVWVALAISKHDFHSAARDWFATQSGADSILFCRATQQSFLRLMTTEGMMRLYDLPTLNNAEAWETYQRILSDGRVAWAPEPTGLEPKWKTFTARTTASPKLWMDAYLAAFALAGNYRLVTTDKGFKQFSGLDALVLSANNSPP